MTQRPIPTDPLLSFRFCPQCGREGLEVRQVRSLNCPACGFRYFINSATAVGGFIFHGDKIILTVRGEDPQKGKLDLPGGFVEFDEAADDGLRREILEELGIAVTDLAYLGSAPNDYLFANVLYKVTDIYYTCRADDISGMAAHDDVAGYCLVDPFSVDIAELAFPSVRAAYAKLLARL